MTSDPLAPLMELPGVGEASEEARDALGRVHRHRANLRGWRMTAAEAALRAARASSVLDGGPVRLEDVAQAAPDNPAAGDPVFGGALRVAQQLEGGGGALVGIWQRAPLQALARLHMLAAADLVDDDRLGRPRADSEVGPRLELLANLVTGRTRAPAPVVAAVAHGELLTLKPFGSADGVVARAVSAGHDPAGAVNLGRPLIVKHCPGFGRAARRLTCRLGRARRPGRGRVIKKPQLSTQSHHPPPVIPGPGRRQASMSTPRPWPGESPPARG